MAKHGEITQLAATLAQLTHTLAQVAQALADAEPEPEPQQTRELPARVLFTVEEAAEQLRIGQTSLWKRVSSGEIESVQIGTARRIPATAIHEYAARLVKNAA